MPRFAKRAAIGAAVAVSSSFASMAIAYDPQFGNYYVGRDLRETIPTGTYAGLPNPNFNRLTLLLAHSYADTPASNHYHAKSPYTYVGAANGAATAVQPFNGNAAGVPANFLPEGTFGSSPRIELLPGSGAFAGRFATPAAPGVEYADLTLRSIDSFTGFAAGTPQEVMLNSSTGRFAGSIANSVLSLVLVEATPGLTVTDGTGVPLLDSAGDSIALGAGDASLAFLPTFVADAPGNYSATFKVVDAGTGNGGSPWGESGQFVFNMTAVPEPASLAALGVVGAIVNRRRRAAVPR